MKKKKQKDQPTEGSSLLVFLVGTLLLVIGLAGAMQEAKAGIIQCYTDQNGNTTCNTFN